MKPTIQVPVPFFPHGLSISSMPIQHKHSSRDFPNRYLIKLVASPVVESSIQEILQLSTEHHECFPLHSLPFAL